MTDGYGTLGDSGTATNNGHRPDDGLDEEYLRAVLADDEFGGSLPAGKVLDYLVQQELQKLRAREAARRALRAETRPAVPAITRLRDFLAVPDEDARYVIENLMPVGARVMLAAQFKAGKSVTVGNALRSLADGDPFLDEFEVTKPAGTIVLIDDELDERTLRRWLRDQGVRDVDRVALVSLRGRVSAFDIPDPDVLAEWADKIHQLGASVIVLDCLRPVLDALGLDENGDAGQFLVAFDALIARSGASEALVVHHMGHTGERSRGDSRLRDWPDAEWRLVRQDDDPASPRFFSAYGRDVDVAERQLGYDPDTRRLSVAGGSRKDAKAEAALPAVLAAVRDAESAPSGRAVEMAVVDADDPAAPAQHAVRAALKRAATEGLLRIVPGPRRMNLHYLTDAGKHWLDNPSASVRRSASGVRQRTESECVSASYRETHSHPHNEESECVGDAPLCSRCGHRPAAVLGRCHTCAYPTETDETDEEPA